MQVPPLIIQPLVENAIKHGLENVTENGKVSITIMEKAEYIEARVTDNGCGMEASALENLKAHRATKSIGLLNVMERLQLLYRREDVMQIRTGENGTEITVMFFKTAKENSEDDPNHDRGR